LQVAVMCRAGTVKLMRTYIRLLAQPKWIYAPNTKGPMYEAREP
jgi:hypothetical protein